MLNVGDDVMGPLFEYRDETLYCHHSLDQTPKPEDFPIHAHETPEVYIFLSGEGHFLVEGTSYTLSPGDILLMRPAETHKLVISPEKPYERIAIHFSEHLFDSLDPARALLRPFYRHPLGQNNLYPASENPALSEPFLDLQPDKMEILARLMLLLAEAGRLHRAADSFGPDSLSRQLVNYVNEHLFEPLSLNEIGRQFTRSASQVSRIFRQVTGTSLWEYVMIKRLMAARAMLQRGDTAINAAAACGFSDYSSFYRAYKKRFGHSPGADRGSGKHT